MSPFLGRIRSFGTSWPDVGAPGRQAQPQEALSVVPGGAVAVRKRGGRKRALVTRAPMVIPPGRNLRWSLGFVIDTLVSSRRFRILTLVDDFTRKCLGLVVDTSLTGLLVVLARSHR